MSKFRKKLVVIEAVQWQGDYAARLDWPHWFNSAVGCGAALPVGDISGPRKLSIKTLEGEMIGDVGDWIICGVEGEIYPCKPGIFAKTYERIDD